MLDILIKNAIVIDGYGRPPFVSDVGILNGRIQATGSEIGKKASLVINAKGLVLSPAFIDVHSHSDLELLRNPSNLPKIKQGVVTEVIGNCGITAVPANNSVLYQLKKYITPALGEYDERWPGETLGDYYDALKKKGTAVNVASYVGHGTVRLMVMGFDERSPTDNEIRKMRDLVSKAMEDGAIGLSSGLIYPPGAYAKTEELIELCRVMPRYGGYYASHIRSESDDLIPSVREALKIGKGAGIPVHISHHKAGGCSNWGRIQESLQLITEARKSGMDVTCDVYPYTAGSSSLCTLLPQWTLKEGIEGLMWILRSPEKRNRIEGEICQGLPKWDNLIKSAGWGNIWLTSVHTDRNKELEGLSIEQIAKSRNKDPLDVAIDLLLEEEGKVTMGIDLACEEDVVAVMRHPSSMFGTDGLPTEGKPHPRLYGTYARILSIYVRDKKLFTLEEAIKKMTYLPATRLGLKNRGIVRRGAVADLVIFNYERLSDKATFSNPRVYPEGIEYVLVSGIPVIQEGEFTGRLPGRILTRCKKY